MARAKKTKTNAENKSKKPLTLAEKLKTIDSIADGINTNANKTIIGRLSKAEEIKAKLIPTFIPTPSLILNEMLGGGWPRRNISLVCGQEDSGKTAGMLECIALNMKNDPDFIALWIESEASLKMSTLEMFGIDLERFVIIEHDRDGAGETVIDRMEACLASGCFDIVVVNSLKCLVPSEEFKNTMLEGQVASQSRMNAKMMRKLTTLVEENNAALVLIQHLTTNIGSDSKYKPYVIAGGKALRYGAMIIAEYNKLSIQAGDPIDKDEGMKIQVTIKKNHIITDRNPYVKKHYYIIYNQGTEIYLEVLDLAIKQGLLAQNKPYIKLLDENGEVQVINGEKMQWQGNAKFREYCINNPEFFEDLKNAVKGEIEYLDEDEAEEYAKDDGDLNDLEDLEEIEKMITEPLGDDK